MKWIMVVYVLAANQWQAVPGWTSRELCIEALERLVIESNPEKLPDAFLPVSGYCQPDERTRPVVTLPTAR